MMPENEPKEYQHERWIMGQPSELPQPPDDCTGCERCGAGPPLFVHYFLDDIGWYCSRCKADCIADDEEDEIRRSNQR